MTSYSMIDYTYADLAIVLVVSWACGIVEAEERNSDGRRKPKLVCVRSGHAKILVRRVGAVDPTNTVPPRGATRIFLSFELCDSLNWTSTQLPTQLN
jgi:hypothetical protein